MKPRILVLGLGNRLMMDDGIGVAVVESLAAGQAPGDELVRYEVGETDFDHSLDLAADCDVLVVVDAAQTGRSPGEVSVLPLRDLAFSRPGLSVHDLHFLDLLLRLRPVERGALIGIEPFRVDFHLGLSPELAERKDEIVGHVRQAIARLIESTASS